MGKKEDELNAAAREQLEILKEQARIRQEISGSVEGYMQGLQKAKAINKTINENTRIQQEFEARILELRQKRVTASKADKKIIGEQIALEEEKLKILEKQTDELREQGSVLVKNLKEVNKMNLLLAKTGAGAVKMLGSLPDLYKKGVGELKSWGLLDMAKATKTAALQMGVFSKQSEGFTQNIRNAAKQTSMMGIDIEELAKMQSSYSEELGRTVILSQQGLESMAAMAKATGLGAEGAARMAADMENQGLSAEKTAAYTEQTMNDAHKMGLNTSKVMKNIASNMKMLNKYNFKGGVQGLMKMSKTATKLGVDMNMVSGMADKLFDIEGAVDMSSQLQVMGGEWSKLADPFKLMYQARNDMEGLMESMGKAAEASVTFNKANGEMSISAYEMHKLRKIAEQTGVSYEELATAGKNARKFTEIKKQMGFSFDKDTQEFIANTATFKDGKATIMLDGQPKLVSQLTKADQTALKTQITQKASMKEMAEQSMNFDEQLTGFINALKVSALPLIDSLNKNLIPKIKGLFDKMEKEKWFDKIGEFAKKIGDVVGKVAGFIIEFPAILAAAPLLKAAMWVGNGLALARGFMMGTKGFGGSLDADGGGMMSKLMKGGKKGGFGRNMMAGANKLGRKGGFGLGGKMTLGSSLAKGGKAFTGLGIAGLGLDVGRGMLDDQDSDVGKAMGVGSTAAGWAGTGALIGSIIPGVGTAIGGAIGGIAGAGKGIYDEYFSDEAQAKKRDRSFGMDDGIIHFNDRDKFMKVGDGTMIAGTNENGNKDLAKTLSGGNGGTMKIEFGEIHFKFDELKVTSPGSPGVAIDLLKDPQFIRNITRMIHSETEKVINQTSKG
jgi:hypothetical protein